MSRKDIRAKAAIDLNLSLENRMELMENTFVLLCSKDLMTLDR